MSKALEQERIREALERFEEPLLRFAATIAGPDAPDVVQDTFLELLRQPWESVEGHLAPWLFTVCRNKALSLRRKSARQRGEEEANVSTSPESGPQGQLEKKEAATRVMRALGDLSDRDREVVSLKFAGGLSYKEISEVTKLSVSHVGVILHEALKKVREHVSREDRALELRRA